VLLLGARGVGKRTMARVWRHLAGLNPKQLPILDLDSETARFPCIAITGRPLPRSIHCRHLDTGTLAAFPESDLEFEEPKPPLPRALMDEFEPRLYMPPLRRRPIDLLALLDFYNRCVCPGQYGRSYHAISAALVYSMFFQWDWPANVHSLISYLRGAAARDLTSVERGEATQTSAVLRLRSFENLFYPGMPRLPDGGPLHPHWGSDEDLITFEELPVAAVWIYRWRCGHAVELTYARPDEPVEAPEVTDPLGLEAVFGHFERGVSPFTAPTKDVSDEESRMHWASRLSVEQFRQLAFEDFIHPVLLLGESGQSDAMTPERGGRYALWLERVRRFAPFGATFQSLQEGLAIRAEDGLLPVESLEENGQQAEPVHYGGTTAEDGGETGLRLEEVRGQPKNAQCIARLVGTGSLCNLN
jgi:hypothetical protein